VFWVHASNTERFRQSFISIAQECCIPGYEDPKMDVLALVKRWLEKKGRGRWLMIIDNADNSQIFFPPDESGSDSSVNDDHLLGQYLPDCSHGSILVTTRNKEAGVMLTKGKPPVEVNAMKDGESEQLLRTNIANLDFTSGQLLALASRLGHLPLALAQAAAYIEAKSITVDRYLQLFDKSEEDSLNLLGREFEAVGRDSKTPRAITKTWILSFKQIQAQNAFASELLAIMSFLDRQAIAIEFLNWYCEQQDNEWYGEVQMEEALGLLKAFSFITQAKDQTLDVHRLVQLVTRKWLAREKKTNQFAGQALLAVSHAFPFGTYDNWVVCNAYLPHVYSVLKFEGTGSRDEQVGKAGLLHCVAGYFQYRGQWADSENLLLEAVKLRREILGSEDPSTLTSMGNLASTYRNQGRWEEAEKLQAEELVICSRVMGADHPDTLTGMANLASTYRNQGRWEEAEKLFVQVMETRKTKLGADHLDTLTSINNLSVIYKH
jgi:tetratricopeptide (TPR) repeat protein